MLSVNISLYWYGIRCIYEWDLVGKLVMGVLFCMCSVFSEESERIGREVRERELG